MTQGDLGKRASMSLGHVSALEKGARCLFGRSMGILSPLEEKAPEECKRIRELEDIYTAIRNGHRIRDEFVNLKDARVLLEVLEELYPQQAIHPSWVAKLSEAVTVLLPYLRMQTTFDELFELAKLVKFDPPAS